MCLNACFGLVECGVPRVIRGAPYLIPRGYDHGNEPHTRMQHGSCGRKVIAGELVGRTLVARTTRRAGHRLRTS